RLQTQVGRYCLRRPCGLLVVPNLRRCGFRGGSGENLRRCAGVMHRFHSPEVCRLWLGRFGGRLLDADDTQDWATAAQLNVRSNSHFDRLCDSLAIYEGAESRVGVSHSAATIGQMELGVLTRNHGPLLL